MSAKYTVFVSSTYTDLVQERDQVIRAVLEMGHIPVGMEMFSAADDEQWRIITNQIDQCDYYVVIVAHKYGSTVDGISYTEKEYDYAVSKGVPALGFIIEDSAPWPSDRAETEADMRRALNKFKEKVKGKPVGFWSSGDELHGKCSIALMKAINTHPRPGWIRATEGVGPGALMELSRLSAENADLRSRLNELREAATADESHKRVELADLMKATTYQFSYWPKSARDWTSGLPITLLRVFEIVVLEAADEAGMQAIARAVAFNHAQDQSLRDKWPVPSNHLKRWLLDLQSLGLIQPSVRKRSVKDTEKYWTTTELGDQLYAYLRRANLEEQARRKLADPE